MTEDNCNINIMEHPIQKLLKYLFFIGVLNKVFTKCHIPNGQIIANTIKYMFIKVIILYPLIYHCNNVYVNIEIIVYIFSYIH